MIRLDFTTTQATQKSLAKLKKASESEFKEIYNHLQRFMDSEVNSFTFQSSGSTGLPKRLSFTRDQVIASARRTISRFNLSRDTRALLALPQRYVAGRMMLYRALIGQWKLDCLRPRMHIDSLTEDYDFAAFVPLQYQSIVKNGSAHKIGQTILGGAPIPHHLEKVFAQYEVFETYGMTETLTHIAVRSLRSTDNLLRVLPGIRVDQDSKGCLIIHDPIFGVQYTKDIVELRDNQSFRIKGRLDYVINSGGLKIHPEDIEKKLQSVLEQGFFIAKEKNIAFGESPVLYIDINEPDHDYKMIFRQLLDRKYWPQKVIRTKIQLTETGKIQRNLSTQNQIEIIYPDEHT